jgi:hypothetical protein
VPETLSSVTLINGGMRNRRQAFCDGRPVTDLEATADPFAATTRPVTALITLRCAAIISAALALALSPIASVQLSNGTGMAVTSRHSRFSHRLSSLVPFL